MRSPSVLLLKKPYIPAISAFRPTFFSRTMSGPLKGLPTLLTCASGLLAHQQSLQLLERLADGDCHLRRYLPDGLIGRGIHDAHDHLSTVVVYGKAQLLAAF